MVLSDHLALMLSCKYPALRSWLVSVNSSKFFNSFFPEGDFLGDTILKYQEYDWIHLRLLLSQDREISSDFF